MPAVEPLQRRRAARVSTVAVGLHSHVSGEYVHGVNAAMDSATAGPTPA